MTEQTTPFDTSKSSGSRGNATIYVLIVVALFAALAFVLSRQSDTSESGHVSREKLEIMSGQILSYPAQVKQAIDMMSMSGTDPSDIDFTMPGQTGFNLGITIKKLYHPDGGGLTMAQIPAEVVAQNSTNPAAGWYLGMFNNVAWSKSSLPDVMLVAYQISKDMCAKLNEKLTGSSTIPVVTDTIPDLFINHEYPPGNTIHSGANADLTVTNCAACENKPSLCVGDSSGTRYGFYSMLINR